MKLIHKPLYLRSCHPQSEGGFTLLEVMVAIIVVSLGLLGALALQAYMVREQRSAIYNGIAAQQIQEMTDRMRANIILTQLSSGSGLNQQNTNQGYMSTATYNEIIQSNLSPSNQSTVLECQAFTSSATANGCPANVFSRVIDYDFLRWNQSIRQSLPGGVGVVRRSSVTDPGAGLMLDVLVAWREPSIDLDANGVAVPLSAALSGCPANFGAPVGVRCLQVRVRI